MKFLSNFLITVIQVFLSGVIISVFLFILAAITYYLSLFIVFIITPLLIHFGFQPEVIMKSITIIIFLVLVISALITSLNLYWND